MQTQLDDVNQKLQELREKESRMRIEFNDEAQMREKLIELSKEENDSCKKKLEEAGLVIQELNQIISEVKEEYTKLMDEKSLSDSTYESTIKVKDETVAKLEQELKNANELLSIAKRKGRKENRRLGLASISNFLFYLFCKLLMIYLKI